MTMGRCSLSLRRMAADGLSLRSGLLYGGLRGLNLHQCSVSATAECSTSKIAILLSQGVPSK